MDEHFFGADFARRSLCRLWKKEENTPEPSQATASESSKENKEENDTKAPTKSESVPEDSAEDTFIFTDDIGREVELPTDLQRIAPSGPMAQTTLLTLVPEKLVALAGDFDAAQEKYFDPAILELPELGNLYKDTLNMESILLAAPQVIVDIGEPKGSIEEDMEHVQEQTGIPTVFIHMELDNMGDAYRKLGQLLGAQEQGNALAEYVENTIKEVKETSDSIAEEDKIRVLYAGEDGLTVYVDDTVHTDVITYAGGKNVAEIESTVRAGGAEVSMEQILLWDPDLVLFVPNTVYDTVADSPEWAEVRAIKEGRFYEGPIVPYNWMGRPPSVSRVLGMKWLGNLLYPEVFDYDMIKETQTFFSLFYHYDISEDEVREILANSTFKK